MDRQQITLKLTLEALGLPIRLDNFDDRMALQKTIYLCQQAGVHLGYRYSWCLRGPYSPALTRDAFDLKAKEGSDYDDTTEWNLDSVSLERLMAVSSLWESQPEENRPRMLELLASVLFLKRSYDGREKDAAGLQAILEKNEKFFSENEVRQALEYLERHGLLPSSAF